MNDIEKDDPLGALMKRTKGPVDSPLDVPEEPDDDAALHDSADAFIKRCTQRCWRCGRRLPCNELLHDASWRGRYGDAPIVRKWCGTSGCGALTDGTPSSRSPLCGLSVKQRANVEVASNSALYTAAELDDNIQRGIASCMTSSSRNKTSRIICRSSRFSTSNAKGYLRHRRGRRYSHYELLQGQGLDVNFGQKHHCQCSAIHVGRA